MLPIASNNNEAQMRVEETIEREEEEYLLPHIEDPSFRGIIYPNVCQSLHLGCNKYNELRHQDFTDVDESYNDVDKYEKFFKTLKYDKCVSIKDKNIKDQKNLR